MLKEDITVPRQAYLPPKTVLQQVWAGTKRVIKIPVQHTRAQSGILLLMHHLQVPMRPRQELQVLRVRHQQIAAQPQQLQQLLQTKKTRERKFPCFFILHQELF